MEKFIVFEPNLTEQDRLVIQDLERDVKKYATEMRRPGRSPAESPTDYHASDSSTLSTLDSWNNMRGEHFRPTIIEGLDHDYLASISKLFNGMILQPYIRVAQSIVRVETDVVMLTNILLYFLIPVPSALFLFLVRFSWSHALLHFVMQVSQMGSFIGLIHNHAHQGGLLRKQQPFVLLDLIFPYIIGPLFGLDWNSFYYHHVKHHHVEGNGPDDLSSTIRYQRDNAVHFLAYLLRFILLVPVELPLYFIRRRRYKFAFSNIFWRFIYYAMIYRLYRCNPPATLFVFILTHLVLQVGFVNANWGQHAFVDEVEPSSDYRSSITVINANENRFGFNDGYHTSHHLNPRRHWRQHPNSFIKNKNIYASQQALVFHNIDYKTITFRLLLQDHKYLAKRMIPIGKQIEMNMDERVNLLKRLVRRMTEKEIIAKFPR